MEDYIPTRVYNNLIKMISYRGAKVTSEILDDETVTQKLNHYEFTTITAVRSNTFEDSDNNVVDPRGPANIICVLLALGSEYATKLASFKKLMKTLTRNENNQTPTELIFVSENELTKHIMKYINKLQLANLRVEGHSYSIFLTVIPQHVSVPKHVVPPIEEINNFCNEHYTTPAKFPKIRVNDPMAVWLGLHVGNVVKIYRISETAGYSVIYRVCIAG